MSEVQGERLIAEAELATTEANAPTEEVIRRMIEDIGDIGPVLAGADPKDKAEVYARLGVPITYHPDQRLVVAEAQPIACTTDRVGGAFDPASTPPLLRGEVLLRAAWPHRGDDPLL